MSRFVLRGVPTLIVLALAVACGRGALPGKTPARPNIILITIESLRADHVHCYGYARETTPALDALAREGILYEQARSTTSWTLTSHASIFTGLYPSTHRVIRPHDRLDDSYETLAERLRAAGYQTAGFVSGPFLRRVHNLQQGFDLYDDSGVRVTSPTSADEDITNPWMEQRLLRFLREQRDPDKPFFLFAYLWDPHYDYIPPPPYDRMFVPRNAEPIDLHGYETRNVVNAGIRPAQLAYVISQYDGEIRWTDDLLGRLWKRLRGMGLWENTAIVVTADHGEAFFEHGAKGHKNSLHVEEIHVPLVIKPAGPSTPRRDGRVANLVRLFPTLLDLAGIKSRAPWLERSLLGPRRPHPPPTFLELETSLYYWYPTKKVMKEHSEEWFAIRDGDFKLQGVRPKGRWQLYDVAADPGERRPLEAGHPAFRPLRRKLEAHLEESTRLSSRWHRSEPAKLSPADENRLRALGYVGAKGGGEVAPLTEPSGRTRAGSGR